MTDFGQSLLRSLLTPRREMTLRVGLGMTPRDLKAPLPCVLCLVGTEQDIKNINLTFLFRLRDFQNMTFRIHLQGYRDVK